MEKVTKKTVVISDALWDAAKKEARKQGIVFSVFIERAIRVAVPRTK
jgi:hypothetical protein